MAWTYILNPGDFLDVREIDRENCTSLKGTLYRFSGQRLQEYARESGEWITLDEQTQQFSVPIKVLRAAGLHS